MSKTMMRSEMSPGIAEGHKERRRIIRRSIGLVGSRPGNGEGSVAHPETNFLLSRWLRFSSYASLSSLLYMFLNHVPPRAHSLGLHLFFHLFRVPSYTTVISLP